MPVVIEAIDERIICFHWVDDVTVDDIYRAQNNAIDTMKRYENKTHVQIVDMSRVKNLPMNIKAMREVIESNPHTKGMVICAAPFAIEMMAKTIGNMIPFLEMRFAPDMTAAIATAKDLLHP